MQNVAVFWDYENCPVPSNGSGYALVNSIRAVAQKYGAIKSLRAYAAVSEQFSTAKSAVLRSELQCSGVSLVDCPHNGRKDVADKMMIVDMLAHAIDNAPSSTIIFLISGDRDFAYAMSTLRLRCYTLVLCAPNNAHASLLAQASSSIDWASVAVLPGACLNLSKQVHEEPQRGIGQRPIPSTPRSSEGHDHDVPLNDIGVINPYMQHAAKHSGSISSGGRGNPADIGYINQGYMQNSPVDPITSYPRRHSFDSVHLNVQDNRIHDMNPTGYGLCHVPLLADKVEETDGVFASNAVFPSGASLGMNAGPEVMGGSTLTRCITPETGTSDRQTSGTSSLTVYPFPVTTPLVVNQSRPIGSPSIQIESVVPSHCELPNTPSTTSHTATRPLAPDVSPLPEASPPVDLPSSKSSAAESVASSTSAYFTAASLSAPVTPEPVRQTPPPQFKALVRILQLQRSNGVLKPTRSQVAVQIVQPGYGNPYKQAGVQKWAQYAELARREGIIELGGWEGAAWVALTPSWYDAHAT